ncbi:hypothetical protein ACNKHP_05050 [Shigella boydii]
MADETLPLFRHVDGESLRKVCEIIRDDIHADAVAITNTNHVLAYVGVVNITIRMAMTSLARLPSGDHVGKIIIKINVQPPHTKIHFHAGDPIVGERGGDPER